MLIKDIKFALLGNAPVVRVVAEEGLDGLAQLEPGKAFVRGLMPVYREQLIGQDATNVAACMRRIRRFGGFKPWGAAASAIEIALWDLAGKAAGLPVHRLLGGKLRDRVRVYNGGRRWVTDQDTPEAFAKSAAIMMNSPEGFTIVKETGGFHGPQAGDFASRALAGRRGPGPWWPNRGPAGPRAISHVVECVAAMKEVLGDRVDLALDMGPGWMLADAIRVLRALEPYNLLWAEDLIAGDYVPWTDARQYRELTRSTTTPVHTGEQIYLRNSFLDLIEHDAVRVIGPDPADVGGLSELKWIAELADAHGIMVAPHGYLNGLLGLAALVQVSATLPDNLIAFEYPVADEDWWRQAVVGLPDPLVRDGFVPVWDAPGLGVRLDPDVAGPHLAQGDEGFFD
ncbi:MAG: mandelate racemase/muconate lactonizing enzyme family protein [Bifidobacteriaceae bacterium]|jgi:L-alanine-DL-glutamate epimerase-like enolase superfamily enzyme|nr:mandelate racemase/muconate lactonizing enzyme family protein [Bifidobacteriaceae bacterium]